MSKIYGVFCAWDNMESYEDYWDSKDYDKDCFCKTRKSAIEKLKEQFNDVLKDCKDRIERERKDEDRIDDPGVLTTVEEYDPEKNRARIVFEDYWDSGRWEWSIDELELHD